MSATWANQDVLSTEKPTICFVHSEEVLTRRYSHQIQSVVDHARLKLEDDYVSLPLFVLRLRTGDTCYDDRYGPLLAYFCHELVTSATFLHSPIEVPAAGSLDNIAASLMKVNTVYAVEYIKETYSDNNICPQCVCNLALVYMKTTLEHRYIYTTLMRSEFQDKKFKFATEWISTMLFNHATPFKKQTSVYCMVAHKLQLAMLETPKFFSEVVREYKGIHRKMRIHLCCRPEEEDRDSYPVPTVAAIDFIIGYMNYVHPQRRVYWAAAFLFICSAASAAGIAAKLKMLSLLSIRRQRNKPMCAYISDNRTGTIVFYSR